MRTTSTYRVSLLLSFCFLIFLTFSCSRSGKKALEKGNYYEAVQQATEKLQKDPRNPSAIETLPQAYRLTNEQFMQDIQLAKNTNQQFRWETVLDRYVKLNELYQKIQNCNACRQLVANAPLYLNEENTARENAATERYALATDLLQRNNREAAKESYRNFERLKQFAPNYRDIDAKLNQSLFAASIKVVVEQAKINSRLYEYSNEYFQGRISEFLSTSRKLNKFVLFYSPQQASQVHLSPDQIIHLEFADFSVGETNTDSNTLNLTSKDSVKVGDTNVNGKKVPVYGKVNAQLTRYHRVVRSRGLLAMEIIDLSANRSLFREDIPGEYLWVNDWAKYNGDDRALTQADKDLCRNHEQLPPPRTQLFTEFCKPIYDQFTNRVKRFYDKY